LRRQAEASVVYEDETVVVFMDLNPVRPGHLLVVPREHAVDLDGATSAHVWSVGHNMARALRRPSMGCEGINVVTFAHAAEGARRIAAGRCCGSFGCPPVIAECDQMSKSSIVG
jgi:diadenosine tetraphosphate (Ap4A) HIT family hydrolase